MTYVTYEFYTETYGGSAIDSDSFTKYEAKSRLQINRYTFNRVKNAVEDNESFEIPEEIMLAQCALMDFIYDYDSNGGKIVASETVSKHSESFVGVKSYDESVHDIVKQYLGGTPWTYRGGGAGDVL